MDKEIASDNGKTWYRSTISMEGSLSAEATNMLETADTFVIWHDEDEDTTSIQGYFEERSDAEAATEELTVLLQSLLPQRSWNISIEDLPHEDWAESWKNHFHTEKVSPRIVIKPSWEEYIPENDENIIELDPGLSFGTGQHGTTKACLKMLDNEAPEGDTHKSMLDLGCGSGILSIAAAKLGYAPVAALDYDSEAVRIAAENAELNSESEKIAFCYDDVSDLQLKGEFDVVAANILASVLIQNAAAIVKKLKKAKESRLILAGILDSQYANVKDIFETLGLIEIESVQINEWQSGIFKWK